VKSVYINVLAKLMGSYAAVAPMETFMESHFDRHPTEVAMLDGPRLVVASETKSGQSWNEARIKNVTGGDRISARKMRGNFYEFDPVFKLTLVGNHAPRLRNVNDATMRRFKIVPFKCKPAIVDLDLEERLLSDEGPQILRWMINGCLDWQGKAPDGDGRKGLRPPERVQDATKRYFERQNTLRRWREERCETGDFDEATAALYEDYIVWMEAEGLQHGLSKNDFSDMLVEAGFDRRRTNKGSVFHGLRLWPRSDRG
jgi:putative DNA primase/helicase